MGVLTQIRNWFNLGTEETEDVGLDALTDELSLGDIEVYESLGDIEVYDPVSEENGADVERENLADVNGVGPQRAEWLRDCWGVYGDSDSYGKGYRLFDWRVAESVTLCGREVIQYSAQNIEDVEDEDTDDTLNQEVADELDRELVEDEEEDAESSEVDGSSQDAASTETVEDSEVEN